ncbi:hypothetical protein XENTR_v10006193 [Xenopus tropicalis]|nr:hypothetical protein XENTR_v10006193 [Xenopus tropicalis]
MGFELIVHQLGTQQNKSKIQFQIFSPNDKKRKLLNLNVNGEPLSVKIEGKARQQLEMHLSYLSSCEKGRKVQ